MGSGSEKKDIENAVSFGVVKMNVDTDTQWAYWEGLLKFYKKNEGYLQGQIGNPDGEDKPNKKYYDPRNWVRHAEVSMTARVGVSMEKLGSKGRYPKSSARGEPQIGNKRKGPSSAVLVTAG